MRLTKVLGTCAVFLSCMAPGLAQDGGESPEAFLQRYYTALHKAKVVMDMDQYCTPMPEKEREKDLALMKENPMLAEFAMEMLKGEPEGVKILSKREEGDKLFMDVAPNPIPAQYAKDAQSPGFSMKGEVVLVKAGKSWKVHKDFWTVLQKDKDGNSKTSFGRNPDGKDKAKPTEP